jgi:hypothetical protein
MLLLLLLEAYETDEEQSINDKKRNDAPTTLRVLDPALLQGEQQTNDSWNKQQGASGIKTVDALQERFLWRSVLHDTGEEEDDDGSGNGANWQVVIEASTPADLICEGATEQGLPF